MGRTISGVVSSGSVVTTTLTAGEAVQQGDILSLASDGKCYWADDPASATAYQRPMYQATASGIYAALPGTQGNIGNAGSAHTWPVMQPQHSALLTNGNVVVVTKDYTNSPYPLTFSIYNASGVLQVGPTTVVSTTYTFTTSMVNVAALTGGGFVVTWQDASGYVNFAIYTNAGGVTTAATVTTATAASAYQHFVTALSGGGFVVAFYSSTTYYGVYTSTGTATRAMAAGSNSCSGMFAPPIALTGGGFVLIFQQSSSGIYATRFNASGVAQGSTITLYTGVGQALAWGVALTGGGFAILAGETSSNNGALKTFDSSGTQQGTTFSPWSGRYFANNSPSVAFAALSSGNYQVIWSTSSSGSESLCNVSTAQFTAAGVQVGTTINLTTGNTSRSVVAAASLNDGGSVLFYEAYNGSTYTPTLVKMTSAGVLLTTLTRSETITSGNYDRAELLNLGSSNMVALVFYQQISPGYRTLAFYYAATILTRVPIGVATASASANASVSVQVTGAASTRLTFAQPVGVNYTSKSPPGQQMQIIGNTAIMNGVLNTSPPVNIA